MAFQTLVVLEAAPGPLLSKALSREGTPLKLAYLPPHTSTPYPQKRGLGCEASSQSSHMIHNFHLQCPNLKRNHSIVIYISRRWQYTSHLPWAIEYCGSYGFS